MTVEYMDLARCEDALMVCPLPVWVFVADTTKFCWANDLALQLWQADSRAELFARDMTSDVPDKVLARTRDVIERCRAGQVVREEWMLYPRGERTSVVLDVHGVRLLNGEFGLLMWALPTDDNMAPSLLRSVAMFRHMSVVGMLVATDGLLRWQNPTATQMFGALGSWLDVIVEADEGRAILARAVAGEVVETRVRVSVRGELRWHRIEAHALRDPISAELGALIEHTDVSASVAVEELAASRGQTIETLSEALRLVERQRQEILQLSAPILDIDTRRLAVPIIGQFDEAQSAAIQARLLDAAAARKVECVILDLTGLAAVDAGIARRLHQLITALRLLGTNPMITGVRPLLALELARLGLDLDGVPTLRSLAEGLRRSR